MTDKRNEPEIIDLDRQAADEIVLRVQASDLPERDRRIICAIFASYLFVVQLLQLKRISIARLKKFVFGARTEKTEALLGNAAPAATSAGADGPGGVGDAGGAGDADADADTNAGQGKGAEDAAPGAPPKRRKGHGRNGADDFPGAERVAVPHPALQAGDDCPGCGQGTLYEKPPATLLRFVGQAPVQATVFELQRLRCHLCGQSFTAEPPPETAPPNAMPADAVDKKYDPSVAILIALLKYGRGLPFYRLSGLQNSLGIPLPPGTQWQLVEELARTLQPVYDELVRQAAQGQLLHHDDTANRILSLMGKRRAATLAASAGEGAPPGGAPLPAGQEAPPPGSQASLGPERTGIFTTGIVSVWEGHQAVLFFTGRQHAGENLQDVLRLRAEELEPPIQMCDALSRNMPAGLKTILANCLAHGRRQFVDVAEYFPQESLHVLLALKGVYHHDELARRDQLSPEERLKFHQIHSAPIMQSLQEWLQRQFDERLVEPNSALGKAISYLLRHWEPFTLFLRKAGAPLDNNICERALKKVILHRKNALFYKTENGASVGDLYMSLIHTCELGGFNPRDYFQQLVRHQRLLASNPEEWMPWNYRQTVASLSHPEPLPAAAVHET